MPVSYVPCITPVLLIGIPLLFALRSRKSFLAAASVSAALLAMLLLSVFVPGWILMAKAHAGNAAAQYEFARWKENHSAQIGNIVFWPFSSDVLSGYRWLERSAAQDYPPALYAFGVRIKHGDGVPPPPNWFGLTGNVVQQPERGQPYIDRAIELGYQPQNEEKFFYWQAYRR